MFLWFYQLDSKVQTALIAGVTAALVTGTFAVFSTFLRDFFAPALTRRLERQKSSQEVFRRYAEPLSAAAISLFWRLNETLAKDGRGYYLSAEEPRSEFENYKLISTYYRVAAMLGCIRALQRELLYFRIEQQRVSSIEQALIDFESALADGHEVELRRLRGLLKLWCCELRNPTDEVHVAVDIERFKRVWMSKRKETSYEQLLEEDQQALLKAVVDVLQPKINTPITPGLQRETIVQALRWLFLRQAWLYRDWQSAIGDLMIERADAGNRSFEVIGFDDFERMINNPSQEQYRCLSRIASIFDGLDVEKDDPFDARGILVRNIYLATSSLITALSSTSYSRYLIPNATLNGVKNVLEK